MAHCHRDLFPPPLYLLSPPPKTSPTSFLHTPPPFPPMSEDTSPAIYSTHLHLSMVAPFTLAATNVTNPQTTDSSHEPPATAFPANPPVDSSGTETEPHASTTHTTTLDSAAPPNPTIPQVLSGPHRSTVSSTADLVGLT